MSDANPEYGPGQEPTIGKSAAQQRREYVESLKLERAGYEQRGMDDRVTAVDAELKRLTSDAKPKQRVTRDSRPSPDAPKGG